MTAQQWIAAYAEKLGVPAPEQATFDVLLEIAAEAAHASDRLAAPVACYLVGSSQHGVNDALELARHVKSA